RRVTVIGKSGNTAPVKRSRCSCTQQLSGPPTETKRCVTFQLVTVEEVGGVVVVEGTVVELAEEEDPPPPQPARIHVTSSVEIWIFIETSSCAENHTTLAHSSAVRGRSSS